MNKYLNLQRMHELSDPCWSTAKEAGLIDISVRYGDAPRMSAGEHEFINMCSCSYLGLDTHPQIIEGAAQGVREAGSLHLTTARVRMFTDQLRLTEERLGQHFQCEAVVYNSCAAASSAFLPILASGLVTQGVRPVMVYDRFAHFSMNHLKPACADHTQVVSCGHNDIEELERLCKQHEVVAFVGDGTYSVAEHAPMQELLRLQERYGMFLYLDDSHGLSITGERGEGFVRGHTPELNERTVVVASLAKAFGACGGMLMSGRPYRDLLARYGNAWSQYLNSAGLGGIQASLDLHQSAELGRRQQRWRESLQVVDERFAALNRDTLSPIRIVQLASPDRAIQIATELFERGFYTSAVFFPVVTKGTAGLRIMPRADMTRDDLSRFADALKAVAGDDLVRGDGPARA